MRTPPGHEWHIGRLVIEVITRRNVMTFWHFNNKLGPLSLELGRLTLWIYPKEAE